MPTCPVCQSRHDSTSGVVEHICKKKDGDHEYSREEAMKLAVGSDPNQPSNDDEDVDKDGSRSSQGDDVNQTPMPESGSEPESDTESCPECGTEVVPVDSHPQLSKDGLPDEADVYCPNCRTLYEVQA